MHDVEVDGSDRGRMGQGRNPHLQKTWSKALDSWRLTETVRMDFVQSVFDFSCCDLHVADGFC